MKLIKILLLPIAWLIFACFSFSASAAVAIDYESFALHAALPTIAFGGLIVNKSSLSILYQAFKTAFNTGFRGTETYWERIATVVPSTTKEEKYGWLGQWPRLREWIGDRQIKNLALHDYSIKNKKFESTVAIPRDDLEDDTYGVFTPLFQEMGHAAKTHPDELVFALLPAGFTELTFDGQFFFDTDHPVNGASVSNMQAGGGTAWFLLDTRRALKPLILQRRRDYDFKNMTAGEDEAVFMRDEYRYGIDARLNVGFGLWQTAFGSKATLDQTNFDSAVEAGMSLKSDEGRPLGITYDLLVCGPKQQGSGSCINRKRKASKWRGQYQL
jgi:phage major head subunit gpT-like protein